MNRSPMLVVLLTLLATNLVRAADVGPPNAGRGAATVPVWNPHRPTAGNPPLTVRVLVLNYDPLVHAEGHRRLSEVFRWNNPARLAMDYKEAMEYASGGYLRFDIVEWRNLNEIYAQEGGHRYTVEEYVRNRRQGKGWRERGMADYPRLLREQNVVPLVDDGLVDEVWIFSDHFFGVWEASMAGPGAFNINGGVYPQVPSRRPFAFYGFNYERGVAEMIHDASHCTEATLNRAYGPWNLKDPKNNWEKFSANHDQSGGLAGVGTCHWPANGASDYDYGNRRVVSSWADAFLTYPKLDLVRKPVSRDTWSKGPDYHLDYMKWYFAHVPRAEGVNADGRQNNWFKYIFDFQNYDGQGKPLPAAAELHARDVADPKTTTHTLHVAYRSADQIDPATLGDDLVVTDPNGKTLTVKLVGGNEPGNRSYRVARYEVAAPGGSWEKASDGPFAVALRPDRVRTGTGKTLPGARLGAFRVARAGSGPAALAADADTTLLAHFENRADGGARKSPLTVEKLRYEAGMVGRGVAIGPGSKLRFASAGVLDPRAGTVEFWLRPTWEGKAGKSHGFFQAGQAFNNGIVVKVDGANNLRLMTWGDDPATPAAETQVERGVGTSAAEWKAGEWHHIAATWAESGRRLALYVDGRLAAAETRGVVLRTLSTPDFWVGSLAGGANPVEAVVDELWISRRARTEAEIRADAALAASAVESLELEVPSEPLPAGSRAVARVIGRAKAGRTQDLTRDAAWTSSDSAVAAVDTIGTLRLGKAGEATLTARIGAATATARVKVADPGLPTARLSRAPDVTRPGAGEVIVVVAYEDPDGIRRDSPGLGDVRVLGPNGFHQSPELVSAEPAMGGRKVTASYRVTPRTGKWQEADRGEYTIEIKGFQVADVKGNHVAEGVLGRFRVLPPAERP